MIYFLSFNISSFLTYLGLKINGSKKKAFILLLSALIIILLIGFRYYVGTDYEAYIDIFNRVSRLDFIDLFSFKETEIGHNLLCKIVSSFGLDFRGMYFTYATLTIFFVYKSISKLKINKSFALLTYFCILLPYSFNIVRQALAMAIFFYAFTFLLDKKRIKAFLILILAALFHDSILFLVPLFIIYSLPISEKWRNNLILIFYILVVSTLVLGKNLITIPYLTNYIGYINITEFSLRSMLMTLGAKLPIFIYFMIYFKQIKEQDKNYRIYLIMFIIEILIALLGGANQALDRLGLYFAMINICMVGAITNINKKLFSRISMYVYLFIYFIIIYYFYGACGIFPYETWIG